MGRSSRGSRPPARRDLGVEPQRRLGRRRGVEIRQHPGAPARADRGPRRLAAARTAAPGRRPARTESPAEKRRPVMRSSATAGGASTTSGPAPRSDTTTGLAIASASRIARCRPSGWIAAFTTTVAAANAAGRSSVGPAMRMTSVGAGRQHQVPQFAGVARLALVLADEDAQEILEAHLLEPAHRLDHDVMTLAAQHAADHQDHLGLGRDAPGVAHRVDALPATRAPDRSARDRCWRE